MPCQEQGATLSHQQLPQQPVDQLPQDMGATSAHQQLPQQQVGQLQQDMGATSEHQQLPEQKVGQMPQEQGATQQWPQPQEQGATSSHQPPQQPSPQHWGQPPQGWGATSWHQQLPPQPGQPLPVMSAADAEAQQLPQVLHVDQWDMVTVRVPISWWMQHHGSDLVQCNALSWQQLIKDRGQHHHSPS